MATPKTALSRGRILGANDRISLGHVGVGQRGRGLEFILSNLKDSKNVEIVGVCDLWKVNLERATTSVRGTYGHAPLSTQFLEELLNAKNIDAVIISTADFQHAPLLKLAAEAGKDFTPAARRKIYEAIRRALPKASRLKLGIMELKLTEVDRRIDERLKRLEQMKARVDGSAPEPVLRGTDVPVHVVAALARRQSTSEIVEDYPILTAEQVEAAVEYAKVYPRTGRPLPTRSLKRMLGDLAAAGVWDLESDCPPVEPQPIP